MLRYLIEKHLFILIKTIKNNRIFTKNIQHVFRIDISIKQLIYIKNAF